MPLPGRSGCPCRSEMSRAPTPSRWCRPGVWAARRGPMKMLASPRTEPSTTIKQLPTRGGAGAEMTAAVLGSTEMRIDITAAGGDTAIGAAARIPAAIGIRGGETTMVQSGHTTIATATGGEAVAVAANATASEATEIESGTAATTMVIVQDLERMVLRQTAGAIGRRGGTEVEVATGTDQDPRGGDRAEAHGGAGTGSMSTHGGRGTRDFFFSSFFPPSYFHFSTCNDFEDDN